jgi:hypothetical protein
MSRFFVSGVFAAALLTFVIPAFATDTGPFDKLAYLTFSAPVQVPGGTLNAGTYRFHLTNPVTSRNVMQVLSKDGTIVYGMFNTIADRRTSITRRPDRDVQRDAGWCGSRHQIAVLWRRVQGVMSSVREGRTEHDRPGRTRAGGRGYGNPCRAACAGANHRTAVEPRVAEPAVAEAVAEAVPPAEEAFPQAEPAVLPRTASPVPIIAVGSGASLLVGLGLALLRRRVW